MSRKCSEAPVFSRPEFFQPRVFKPAPAPVRISLAAPLPVWAAVHFERRSLLCPGQGCALCFEGRPARHYAFYALRKAPTGALWQACPTDVERVNALFCDDPEAWLNSELVVSRTSLRRPCKIDRAPADSVRSREPLSETTILKMMFQIHGVFISNFEAMMQETRCELLNKHNHHVFKSLPGEAGQ